MEPETEQLLKKWLKLQIWQHWLQIINRIILIAFLIIGFWIFLNYIFPAILKQLEVLQTMIGQLSQPQQTIPNQEDFVKILQKQL